MGLAAARGLAGLGRASAADSPTARPNVVFILIDDMGWRDLACYGSTFYETPHIDHLASQGMRFTNAYAACPVCSPTRASILTGKYPARLHLTDWIAGHKRPWGRLKVPDFNLQLPLEETTLAEALKPAGYVSASIGKWHLGKEPFYPEKQGFDLNVGGTQMGQPPSYFAPYKIPTLENGREGEYLTDRLADEAIKFIEANRRKPFFLYLSHFAVHTPLQAKKEAAARYRAKVKPGQTQRNPVYAAMVESVDECVGKVLAQLDDLGLADRTIVFFMSDNGGLVGSTSNAPLREGKGTLYEGGIREPLIVRWPGVVRPGSDIDAVVTSVDFFPTILAMAGVADPVQNVDGIDITPVLRQTGTVDRDAIYWHYPHYHPCGATPGGIVREGDWKLIEYYEDGRLELYNLRDDLAETKNLAGDMPDKAGALRKKLHDWLGEVNAQMPTPNPDYDPAKDAKTWPKPRQN
ncbi:MAG: sulfatase [Planctomycetes bacterium]|nr:sulfatase [Planctomycetota bacterium]